MIHKVFKEFSVHLLSSLFSLSLLTRCQQTYYSTLEKMGYHKREIMVERVEDTAKAQQKASEEFSHALKTFSEFTHFDGGDLETMYEQINTRYLNSKTAVEKVDARIIAIESVAKALFEEWQNELTLYSSNKLRKESEKKLASTQKNYQQMLAAMKKAQDKMQPVLNTLKDNALFLKHNLNASAISSLKTEFKSLQREINRAINEMEAAIAKSERFIALLKKEDKVEYLVAK